MVLYPTSLVLSVDLLGDSLNQVTREWIESINRQGFSKVKAWVCPISVDEPYNNGGLEDALQYLMLSDDGREPKKSFYFELDDGSSATVFSQRFCDDKKIWSCKLSIKITETNAALIPEYVHKGVDLCRHLLREGLLHKARLFRFGGGLQCIPDPPLAEADTHLLLTTHAEIENSYEDSRFFWLVWQSMGVIETWRSVDDSEPHDEKVLLIRGLDATDDANFLEKIFWEQWELAFNAKAGLTKYYPPRPQPEERAIYEYGDSCLLTVGYLRDKQLVVFSCHLEPDDGTIPNIPGWEIYNVFNLIEEGSLPDGPQVKGVRIIFEEQRIANSQQRSLLDIGAEVWYYDSKGELTQITA